jgi:hypothetical protein
MSGKISTIIVVLCCLCAVNLVAQNDVTDGSDEFQMTLQFHGKGFGTGNGNCSLGSGERCEGIAWSGQTSGFSFGSISRSNQVDGPELEVVFSFSVSQENSQPFLDGVIYSLDVASDLETVTGKRKEIHEPIEIGRPHLLAFQSTRGDKSIEMEYTIAGGSIQENIAYGPSTFTVKSFNQSDPGRTIGSQTVDLIQGPATNTARRGHTKQSPLNFQSTFFNPSARTRGQALEYHVSASFDPPLDLDKYPQRTTMTYSRIYFVDTAYQAGSRMKPTWDIGYSFSKSLEIVPGKVLKFVFPPNQGNSTGFEIEDTVIIVP